MKITRNFRRTLVLMVCMVLMAGCRPTIEFEADSSTASPGSTVNLNWDVEFAKGTTSSKVTVTSLGEVEPIGAGEVVVNETKDFQIRVSTFVLGMPITSKQSLTITVPEDNFQEYDFEIGGAQGWEEGYAFYPEDRDTSPASDAGVLCANTLPDSSAHNLVVPPDVDGILNTSLKFCLDNDAIPGDDSDYDRYTMAFVQRKITNNDGYDIERDTTYKVGYEVTYGVRFSAETCEDIDERLVDGKDDDAPILSNLRFVLGAAREVVDTRSDDDIRKLELEELATQTELETITVTAQELGGNLSADEDYAVDGPEFETIIDKNGVRALKFSDEVLRASSEDLVEELEELGCEDRSGTMTSKIIKGVFKGISDTNFVEQTTADDRELHLFFGLLNKTDENDIEFFIDKIKVQIQELEAL
ncbi:MAG: hypothetical protein R3208_05140 [Ketobacteraceae bacterium]|nr:hypothetical protein [Ketobacteraceae bacterium]